MAGSPRGVRALLRDSLGYGLGNAAVRATSIVLVPIFTRALAPQEFAVLDLLTAATVVTSMILTIGLDSAVWRFYYEAADDVERRTVIFTALVIQIVASTIAFVCLIPSASWLGWLLTGEEHRSGEVVLAAAATPFLVAMGTFNVVLRTQFRVRTFNLYAICQFLAVAICDIAATRLVPGRAGAVLAGSLVAYALLFGVGLVLIRRDVVPTWSTTIGKRLLRFGYPLVPAALGIWSLPLIGRYIVAHDIGLRGAAEMAVAAKVAATLTLLFGAFQAAWGPFALSIMTRKDAPATYSRVLMYALAVGSALAGVVSILARPIVPIVATGRYASVAPLVCWLSFGTLFATIYSITIIGAMIHKRPEVVTLSIAIACAANVIAAFALTPRYGTEGAAVAIFIGQGLSALLPALVPRWIYESELKMPRTAWVPAVIFGLAMAGGHIAFGPWWHDAIFRGLLLSAEAAVLVLWIREVGLVRFVQGGLNWLRPALRTS